MRENNLAAKPDSNKKNPWDFVYFEANIWLGQIDSKIDKFKK